MQTVEWLFFDGSVHGLERRVPPLNSGLCAALGVMSAAFLRAPSDRPMRKKAPCD